MQTTSVSDIVSREKMKLTGAPITAAQAAVVKVYPEHDRQAAKTAHSPASARVTWWAPHESLADAGVKLRARTAAAAENRPPRATTYTVYYDTDNESGKGDYSVELTLLDGTKETHNCFVLWRRTTLGPMQFMRARADKLTMLVVKSDHVTCHKVAKRDVVQSHW
jgi:hypothetical protein